MAARVTIGAIWLLAVSTIVIVAFAMRSSFAEVNPLGGVFIVVGCAIGIGIAVALIESPFRLAIAAVAGALFASQVAWGVLHDEHSTAAIGVIVPPFVNGIVGVLGAGIDAAIDRRRSDTDTPT